MHGISVIMIIILTSIIAGSVLFSNVLVTKNNNISFMATHIAVAQTAPPAQSSKPLLRNVELISSLGESGDPSTHTIGLVDALDNCEGCSQFVYKGGLKGVAGVVFKISQGADLSSAKRIVFFARGETAGEKAVFLAIGKNSSSNSIFPKIKFAVITTDVSVPTDWKRYEISLANLSTTDLTGVTAPFAFILKKVPGQGQTVFYIKGISIDSSPTTTAPLTTNTTAAPLTTSSTAAPLITNTTVNATSSKNGLSPTAKLTTGTPPLSIPSSPSQMLKTQILPAFKTTTSQADGQSLTNNTGQNQHQQPQTSSPKTNASSPSPTQKAATSSSPTITSSSTTPTSSPTSNTLIMAPRNNTATTTANTANSSSAPIATLPTIQPVLPTQPPQQQQLSPIQQQQVPTQQQSEQQPVQQQNQSSPPSALLPPIANAGVSQIVEANTNVVLDGRNSYIPVLQQQAPTAATIAGSNNNNRNIIGYQWTQLPIGVPVNIIGANTPTPTFKAPMLPYDTTLAFSLRVISSDGAVSSNTAVVYVMVKHYSGAGISGGGDSIQQQQPPQQQLAKR